MDFEPIKFPLPPYWGAGVPPKAVNTPCGAGCDVRLGSFDVCIGDLFRPRPGVSIPRILFYGKVRDEADVIYLCQQYPVKCGVADCRPESTLIKRMIEKMRRLRKNFWRAQYPPNSTSNVEMVLNEAEHLVTLHRTMTLDEVFFAVSNGMMAVPQNFMEICHGDFVKELTNPTRVPVIERGEENWHWTKGKDHPLHAIGYWLAAMKIGKLSGFNAEILMPVRGAVKGIIGSSTDRPDDPDSEFVDLPSGIPGMADVDGSGRSTWGDDMGF